MAANAIYGAHGRDVSDAELAWSSHPDVAIGTTKNPITFHDVLSAINPLQYLPVVGTIYRAATGDDANPGLRTAVSMVSGLLLGGPLGLLTNIGSALLEHFLPVEQMARSALATSGVNGGKAAAASATPTQTATAPAPAVEHQSASVPTPSVAPLHAAIVLAAYDRVDSVATHVAGVGRSG